MDLAQNVEKYFHHGWFVVRNRTPLEAESSLEPRERQLKEQTFFRDVPWNAQPEQRRGTQALKKYLAELLCSRIKENFPVMLSTIRNRINVTQSRLESLGATRKTVDQKRIYLTRLSQVFHLDASQALRGRYEFSTSDSFKLRKLVREANDAFAKELKEHGHTVAFLEIESPQEALKRPTYHVENKNPISTTYDSKVGKEQEELPTYIATTSSDVRLYQDYYSAEEIKLRNYKKNPENLIPSGQKLNLPIAPNKPISSAPKATFGQPTFGSTSSFLKPLEVSQAQTPKVSSGSFGSQPVSSAPSLFTKPSESHHQNSSFGGGSFGSGSFSGQAASGASSIFTKPLESHNKNSAFGGGLFGGQAPPPPSSIFGKPLESGLFSSQPPSNEKSSSQGLFQNLECKSFKYLKDVTFQKEVQLNHFSILSS